MADWFDENAPKSNGGQQGDWFSQNAAPTSKNQTAGIPSAYNGGQPPPAAAPPTPEGLKDPEYNFWTSPTGLIRTGLNQATHGVEAMAEPGADAKMEGASQTIHGLSKAAAPVAIGAAIPAVAASPLAALGGIAGAGAGGSIASTLGKAIVQHFGGGEGASDLAGDVAGVAGGAAGGAVGALSGKAVGGVRNWISQRDPEAIKDAMVGIIPRGSQINKLRHLPTKDEAAAALAKKQAGGQIKEAADGNLYRIQPDNTAVPIVHEGGEPMKAPVKQAVPKPPKPKAPPALGRTINPQPQAPEPPPVKFRDQPAKVVPPPAITFRNPPPPNPNAPAQAPEIAPPPNVTGGPPVNPNMPAQPVQNVPLAPSPGPIGPSAAPGSVVIPPAEGMPPRYGDIGGQFGSKMAADAYAKDVAIAKHLTSKGITPDQLKAASDAQRKSWAREANPKYKGINPERLDDLINQMTGGGGQ